MAIRDESRNRVLHVSPDILRYRHVEKISDYLKIKARHRASSNGTLAGKRNRLGERWRSMSGIERMTVVIVISTVIGTLATVATLFVTVW
jgi:hypothetical protein